MKKYSILVAAFAMLAFAGCNKEEQRVVLNFGGEDFVSMDKEAYGNNSILFTAGDKAYVNGVAEDVNVIGNGRYGRIYSEASTTGAFEVHYPAATVRQEGTSWKTTFLRNITLIPAMGTTPITNGMTQLGYQVWPMSSYIDDLSALDEDFTFKLYNNVAILSPAVKYGPDFAEAMWSDNGVDDLDWVRDDDNLPTLTITKVVLSSTQIPLTGDATLQNPTASAEDVLSGVVPYFKMDRTSDAPDSVVATVAGTGFVAVPTTSTSAGVNTVTFGNIPVAPYNIWNKTMNIAIYFNATVGTTTHYYKYLTSFQTGATNYWMRSARTSLVANFYNPDLTDRTAFSNKFSVRTAPFGE